MRKEYCQSQAVCSFVCNLFALIFVDATMALPPKLINVSGETDINFRGNG